MSSNHLPPVELFTTSILSNHKVRSRHERYTSVLAVKKIPFVYHDLASDEDAKSRWRRKAKDPQIPGLLVHNEWRGTFEEFEEAVEFGELNLFLNIDPSRSLPPIPTQSSTSPAIQSEPSTSNSTSTSTSSVKLKPMPTAMPQMAPAGSGKREETAEDLMASLSVELDEFNLSESDVSTLLEEMELEAQADRSARSIKSSEETIGESKDQNQNQNGLGSRSISTSSSSSSKIGLGQPPPRTYIPSSDAGVKPLRFARMGSGNMEPQSMTDRASSINLNRSPTDSNSNSASSNRSSSMFSSNSNADARYSSSSRSTKALAAEASALASSRNFSSKSFKESMKSGKDLQDALRSASSSNALDQHVVGKETAEDLLASLGLGDLDLTEEEAEKFLLDGEVPDGLDESGYRFKESKKNHLNKADRAREEVAAREVAQRARDRGHLPRDSTGSRSSIITTGSSKSNASNGKEEMIANPQEASEVKDAVEEQKKNDVEMKDEAEEKKDLQEEMKDLEKEKVEQKKDVDEGNQAQDVTAVETSASSDKDSKEQTVEPEVKDESQDTVIQPLNQQDLTSSDTKDLSPTPGSLSTSPLKASDDATPSGVVSAAPQDQDQDPTSGKPETDSEKVLDSTSTAQDQKAEVTKENDAENSEKLSEKVASLPADSVTVPESSESAAAASDSKPSIETPIAQSLEDESLGKLNPEEVKKDQKPSAAEETSSATTDPTSTATTALEEKTPKGAAAELQSETEQLPSSTPSTEPPLPTNASSTSLSSRKGSLSNVQTDLPRSNSSGSEKLSSSKSSNLPSDAPPVSPSASKALAVSTSSSSLSNGERRKRSGSGAGGGPTTPTSGRRALDFRRSEGPSSPLSPGSASGRRSNAASPPPMPPLPRSLSQMSKSESNGSSISINNNSTSPSSYTSPPISPGPDGKPLKKKRSMSLPRFGKKDKETKEREKEEKEEKKRAKKVGLNSPINSPVTSPVGGRSGGGGGHQRTISDILREADAAMNGDLDLDDDLDLDAVGSEEEPDDGLGPAELPDDEDAPVRA